jgi:hypothetical protein
MAPPTPAVKTSTVTVYVDTDNGTVNVVQSPDPGSAGEFVCKLETTGVNAVSVKGFIAFLDQSDLTPDSGTVADSFQGVIFPFQDQNGNELTPTFTTQTTHGSVNAVVTVFLAGAFIDQPMEQVVIVDW